jgi:cytochrome c-type biogenesis protein CcmE
MRLLGGRIPLRLVVLALVVAGAGAWLAFSSRSLGENLLYAYTPSDVARSTPRAGNIRVGGQVAPGSVRWDPERRILRFVLRDGDGGRVPVVQRGAPPALFRAGEGAVVEGRLVDGVLVSSNLIVRHDNEYRPPGENGDADT